MNPSAALLALSGFLGTRASFMLDFVFVAMFAVLPILAWSIYQVRYRQNYALHKRTQLVLGVVLLVAVVLFEVDLRLFTDWQALAEPSPYFQAGAWNPVWIALIVHLLFAIPTAVLWAVVIIRALRNFPVPPQPDTHSRSHVFWAWIATTEMVMTAVTGWIFYWLAFGATA